MRSFWWSSLMFNGGPYGGKPSVKKKFDAFMKNIHIQFFTTFPLTLIYSGGKTVHGRKVQGYSRESIAFYAAG